MIYDVIIAGSGPAGMSAAIYASRAGLKYAVIEKMFMGIGQISEADNIENYPGFDSINGFELGMKMREQVVKCGTEFINSEILKIEKKDNLFYTTIKKDNQEIISKSIIYALGASHKHLNIEGESEFLGKGVSYCAVCDGAFYRNKKVLVNGGGDTALSEALYLSKLAEKVYIVHRRNQFRASDTLQKKVMENKSIEMIYNAEISKINGDSKVKSVSLRFENTEKNLNIDGVFIAIGMSPQTEIVKNITELNQSGYIKADENGTTSLEGFFAAGDVREKSLRQIITAVSDGANCVNSVEKYLSSLK